MCLRVFVRHACQPNVNDSDSASAQREDAARQTWITAKVALCDICFGPQKQPSDWRGWLAQGPEPATDHGPF